jgi:hypothetical protein
MLADSPSQEPRLLAKREAKLATDFELRDVSSGKKIRFMKKNPRSALILMTDNKIERVYAEQGIPLTLIIDRDGMIRYSNLGYSSGLKKKLNEVIESLLNEP